VVDRLAAGIRDGKLQPGQKLPPETEIMARFEVSRTVVREAISRLQASQLVRTRHGIGTFVIEPAAGGTFRITPDDLATVADVISVLELRISLETESAGLAAQRRSAANLKAMRQALRDFRQSIRHDSDAVPAEV
jgi:GntR family transcriptional regulator, transcriptional repressor for pyruvate dehydrogenase complex